MTAITAVASTGVSRLLDQAQAGALVLFGGVNAQEGFAGEETNRRGTVSILEQAGLQLLKELELRLV